MVEEIMWKVEELQSQNPYFVLDIQNNLLQNHKINLNIYMDTIMTPSIYSQLKPMLQLLCIWQFLQISKHERVIKLKLPASK